MSVCVCVRARAKDRKLIVSTIVLGENKRMNKNGCNKAEEADKKMKSQKFFMSIIRIQNNDPEPGIEPPPSSPG